jgi:hypothetical protein
LGGKLAPFPGYVLHLNAWLNCPLQCRFYAALRLFLTVRITAVIVRHSEVSSMAITYRPYTVFPAGYMPISPGDRMFGYVHDMAVFHAALVLAADRVNVSNQK